MYCLSSGASSLLLLLFFNLRVLFLDKFLKEVCNLLLNYGFKFKDNCFSFFFFFFLPKNQERLCRNIQSSADGQNEVVVLCDAARRAGSSSCPWSTREREGVLLVVFLL